MKKRVLSLALALVMMLSLLPATAHAAASSGSCGTSARWSLDSTGTLTISGTGTVSGYYDSGSLQSNRAKVKKVVIKSGITEIDSLTFDTFSNLTSVTLPSGLKKIGSFAFSDCEKLTSVTLPASLESLDTYAFYNCSSLKSITIPSKIKVLPEKVFSRCAKLSTVTLPAGLKEIQAGAFDYCGSLKTVTFKGTAAQWKKVTVRADNTPLTGAAIKCSDSTISKKYTVTFSANGGTVATKSKTVTGGGTYGTLPTAIRNGYNFSGWYTSASGGTKVTASSKYTRTSNQTLYAHWTGKKYTVTFNANSGSVSTKSKSVTYGGTYGTLPTPTRTGYAFAGWYTSASGGTKVTSSSKYTRTSGQTLYAQWTKKSTSTGTGGGSTTTPSGNYLGTKTLYNGAVYQMGLGDTIALRNPRQPATMYYAFYWDITSGKNLVSIDNSYNDPTRTFKALKTGTVKGTATLQYSFLGGSTYKYDYNFTLNITAKSPGSTGTGTGTGTGGGSVTPTTPTVKVCRVCNGSGRVTCLTCGGSGRLNGHTCPSVLCVNGKKMCFTCGGDGRL